MICQTWSHRLSFIDEHVRLQRYAIHQILFISWLLTGSWADIYTWLRDLFFRHVSEVSWALLLARGCMRLVDSVVDAAARRVLLARMCGPTAKRCLSFATWQLGCVCLILAAGRELALQLLGRDPEYDTSSVIELLLEIVAAPLARCCGTTLALSLVAEFWAVMVVVLVWFEELRLLQAMGRYNAAMVIKAKCLARKAEIRRGEIQRKQSWSLSRAADDTRAISSGTLIGSSLQPANLSPPSAALSTTPSAQLSPHPAVLPPRPWPWRPRSSRMKGAATSIRVAASRLSHCEQPSPSSELTSPLHVTWPPPW